MIRPLSNACTLAEKQQKHASQMGTSLVKLKPRAPEAKLMPRIQTAPQPKAVNALEQSRRSHNDSIREDVAASRGRRYAFLGRHIDALTPFITDAVQQTIR